MKTEIKEYSETALVLDDLTDRLSVVPDYGTKEGYESGEVGRKELKKWRITLEKARKEKGKEAREHLNLVNSEAGRISEVIVGLEKPFIDAKKTEDEKAERIAQEIAEKEQKRIDAIELAIHGIKQLVNCPRTADVKLIDEWIKKAEQVDDKDADAFGEFMDAAKMAKTETLGFLNRFRDEAVEIEEKASQVAAEEARQEEQRKAMAEQQAEMDDKQAELDRQEQAKKDEDARLAKEKADKEQAEIEAKAQAEREAKERKDAEAKILSDRKRYANDEAELAVYAQDIDSLRNSMSLAGSLETAEANEILNAVDDLLTKAVNTINQSAVVQSQHVQTPTEEAT